MKRLTVLFILLITVFSISGWAAKEKEEAKAVAEVAIDKPAEEKPAVCENPEQVIVKVNGQEIKEKQIFDEVEKRVEAQKKRMPAGWEIPQERWDSMRKQLHEKVSQMLVDLTLIDQQMKKHDLKVTDKQVEDKIDEIAKERNITRAQILEQIAQYGMNEDDLKMQIRIGLQRDALIAAEAKDAGATEEDAKKYYDENIERFKQPEQVHAAHILIKSEEKDGATDEEKQAAKEAAKKKAEEVLKKVKDGGDFAALAKEYSADPGSKDKGGEYTFPRGQMVKPFEDAAFSMAPGQVCDEPVETQFGYHIIKVIDKQEAQTQPFDEVRERLTAWLDNQAKEKFWQEYHTKIVDNAKIEWTEGYEPAPPAPRVAPAPQPAAPKPANSGEAK